LRCQNIPAVPQHVKNSAATIPVGSHTIGGMRNLSLRQSFARFAAVVFAGSLSLAGFAQNPDEVLLKDYKPRSIFKIPETRVEKALYPVIDVHSHDYAPTAADVERWVKTMDAVGLEKPLILSGTTGTRFDSAIAKYGKYPKRFSVWCGIDLAACATPTLARRLSRN
jgi:hypothetical protein